MEVSWRSAREFLAPDLCKAGVAIIIFSAIVAVNTLFYDPLVFSCRSGSWHNLVLLNFRGCMAEEIYSILSALQWFASTLLSYFVSCALCGIAGALRRK